MNGVQEQIKHSLEKTPELTKILIFYISDVNMDDKNRPHFIIEKMEVGEE